MTGGRRSSPARPPAAAVATSRSWDAARAAPVSRAESCGEKWLDPESVVTHLGRLMRTARALCGSRENAEDLVQETTVRVLARPRLLRGDDELPYLMQALRNTFTAHRRTATRRPQIVATLERFDAPDPRAAQRPEEAAITAQLLVAIAHLPEPFRLALVAVDIAGLSYGEAARALHAPEATITTRLHRARLRVAREVDPERVVGQAATLPQAPAVTRGTRRRRVSAAIDSANSE